MEFRAAVLNLFDHRPPTTADRQTPGYSTYGDARRRRMELTIAVPFHG
jgi:hypothetical protein